MREMRLFSIVDDAAELELEVAAIHDEAGYRRVREALARQHDLSEREPNIQVWNVDVRGDRSLTLRHSRQHDRPLSDDVREVLKHVSRLWGFKVQLESVDNHGKVVQRWEAEPPRH
jgi:stage V sporulation protein R